MQIIGVTGGIGSGKTTFCRELEKLGAAVYYADEEAKRLMVQDRQLIENLKQTFGKETYKQDGTLNKKHLIREAFEKGRVEELNNLVHPAVGKDFRAYVKRFERSQTPMVVKEAALMLNQGRPKGLDTVILIMADSNKRLKRVADRDQVSRSEVEARILKQPNFEKLIDLADQIIYNNGTEEDLKEQARLFFGSCIS